MGELWSVYCEDFGEYLPCYNGTTLYVSDKNPETYHHPMSISSSFKQFSLNANTPALRSVRALHMSIERRFLKSTV